MQLFAKIQMASEDVKSYLHTGVFYAEDEPAQVYDGAVVVVGELLDHDVYAGMKDMNKHKLTAPAATTDYVSVVDYVGVNKADVYGDGTVVYNIGEKILGVQPKVGENVRVRDLKPFDKFFIAVDNFTAEPTVGEYAQPTANDTRWTPVAAQTAGTTTVRVEYTKPLIAGMVNDGVLYACTVLPNT